MISRTLLISVLVFSSMPLYAGNISKYPIEVFEYPYAGNLMGFTDPANTSSPTSLSPSEAIRFICYLSGTPAEGIFVWEEKVIQGHTWLKIKMQSMKEFWVEWKNPQSFESFFSQHSSLKMSDDWDEHLFPSPGSKSFSSYSALHKEVLVKSLKKVDGQLWAEVKFCRICDRWSDETVEETGWIPLMMTTTRSNIEL